ncbi:BTB/POZ domain-containing protein 19 [Fusarium falciforme]|nr:BTB/POZ domain-containing protein 19 [Fusarium falciforme]
MTTPEDVKEWTTEALCANWSNTALRKFLYSGEFSDLTIRCGDREFKTHRAIVCPQSPFFKAAVGGNFEEGGSGIVDLPDDDPVLVQYLIVFLYTGAYWVHISPDHWDILCDSQLKGDEGTGHEILERLERPPVPRSADTSVTIPAKRYHTGRLPCGYRRGAPAAAARKENQARENMKHSIQIYVLADKYDVPGLRLLARDRFLESGKECCITNSWHSKSWEDTNFFSDIVDVIYKNTPSGGDPLRLALHQLIGMKEGDDVMKSRTRGEMVLNGELAMGVMDYIGAWD